MIRMKLHIHIVSLALVCFFVLIEPVFSETAEQLFYRGRFETVLQAGGGLDPQMEVLTLAELGRFSDAVSVISAKGVNKLHPLNALILSAAALDVESVHKRLGALPEKLQPTYTRLLLSSWISQGELMAAERLLALLDPDQKAYFSWRFQVKEKQGDISAQRASLRAWALRAPGDQALHAAFARFSLLSKESGSVWDVLFPQERLREQAAKRAFDTRHYKDGLLLVAGLTQPLSPDMQLAKGMALYNTRKREEALTVFQSIPESRLSKKDAALLRYQLAKTFQVLKRYDEAAAVYKSIIGAGGEYRSRAYYDLYWMLAASGNVSSFAPFESGFLSAEGKSSYYEKWVWDSSWMLYLNGSIAEAYAKVKSYPWKLQDEFRAKVLFWTAEMADKVDQESAAFYRERCVQLYPFTYYGARLIVRYFPSEINRLSGLFVGESGVRVGASTDKSYRAGLGNYDAAVLSETVSGRAAKVVDGVVLKLLRLYTGIFQPNQAIALLGKMGFGVSSGQATLSREMAEFMYPRPQWELIQALAAQYGLDPYLILALMREESLFNSQAVSRTGARGLMQIMPDTGRGIAKNLKVTWSDADMLFDPETNIRFGVFYLNYLKQRFDGNVVYMLSGYNAGPNATHRWVQRDGTDSLDTFVAKIPYAETHHYVTRVLKSYWIYTLLYNPGYIPDIFRKG
jgi:soluble lytic murein transglycosylase